MTINSNKTPDALTKRIKLKVSSAEQILPTIHHHSQEKNTEKLTQANMKGSLGVSASAKVIDNKSTYIENNSISKKSI